jgi:hypothetical protein
LMQYELRNDPQNLPRHMSSKLKLFSDKWYNLSFGFVTLGITASCGQFSLILAHP